MTENKRFMIDVEETYQENAFFEYNEKFDDYDFVCFEDDFDEILKKFNELADENAELKSENKELQTRYKVQKEFYGQLNSDFNNLRIDNQDLIKENQQLKQALREELEDNGSSYRIRVFNELFDLNYNEWKNNQFYVDWEGELNE